MATEIGLYRPPTGDRQICAIPKRGQIFWLKAQGHDHQIRVLNIIGTLNHLGALTACRIRRAEAHFLNLDTCYRIANKTFWRGQPNKFYALFFGVLNFALAAGHIRAVTAI